MVPNNRADLAHIKYFHPDLLLSTEGWPTRARVIYLWLIVNNWYHGPLPTSVDALAERCGVPVVQFRPLWHGFIRKKFVRVKGGLANPRVLRDREEGIRQKEAAAESGRRGGIASARSRGVGGPRPVGEAAADLLAHIRERRS